MLSAVVYFLQILGIIEAEKMKETYSYQWLHKWWPYCMDKIAIWLPALKNTLTTFSNPFKLS
jgi:hypothetical protein